MAESPHYKELLQLLNECEVDYLIVGGCAAMKYTEPRYTKDLDIWIDNSSANSKRVFQALGRFGAPVKHHEITPENFTKTGIIYQIGVAPVRIALLTSITGVEFRAAWLNN
jgi:hypothetical protein